ncbi:AraC family transcriptional regulator [Glaciecola sp. 1036]|uniref:helix-turn-helix transcriptional regulator n=1 Tax=Alteromonadaceae TaxID=72275 RepID=UPI003CFD6242
MDTLSVLLQDLDLRAEVFYSGGLCGLLTSSEGKGFAHLHFLKSGKMTVMLADSQPVVLDKPTIIFFPAGCVHRIFIEDSEEAVVVCANIHFDRRQQHLLVEQLPRFLWVPLSEAPPLQTITEEIFSEAFEEEIGRQWIIDRLCDIFMMRLLRYVVDTGRVNLSQFTAATQPAIMSLISALSESPESHWTVESMANKVAMSRSKFASLFKQTLGLPPLDYLTDLRISKAQNMLLKDKPVTIVAEAVGYENASSLARVFKKRTGLSPKQWLADKKNP